MNIIETNSGICMKFKKIFFVAFIVAYIAIGYVSAMVVGIKWNESASTLTRFFVRTKMAFLDDYALKILISLVCAAVANFVSSEK